MIGKVIHNLCIFWILRPVGCEAGSCYFQQMSFCFFFFFTCSRESHLLESQVLFLNKWTAEVLTPLYIMYEGLCCHFLLCLSHCFLVGAAAHSQSLYWVYSFGFFSGGAVVLGPNNLWSTSPIQKSTIETTLREVPSMPKWVVLSRQGVEQVECVHTVLTQKMVYKQDSICRQIHRPTNASQMPDGLVSASKPKFWYLHRTQFQVVHVLHLSGAGWSRLPWNMLPAAFDVTVPDGSAPAG